MQAENYSRRTSFIERYIIERARHFRVGYEKEDGWLAIQDAGKLYEMIQQNDEEHRGEVKQAFLRAVMPATAPLLSPAEMTAVLGAMRKDIGQK